MLIRYQAYFNQKVATWLRDRISHSIEATSYGRFYEKNSQTYISYGLQVTWNRLKGMRLIQPLMLSEELFRRLFRCGGVIHVSLVHRFTSSYLYCHHGRVAGFILSRTDRKDHQSVRSQ